MKLTRDVYYTYRRHFRKEEKLSSSQRSSGGRSPQVRAGNFQSDGECHDGGMSSLTVVVA